MKKILIAGENSYIGSSVQKWLYNWPDQYSIDVISVMGNEWKDKSFSMYDVILLVAGIAHVSPDPKSEDLYFKINRDLAIDVAVKAKNDGVNQFIFMSSIIVYGDSSHINKKRIINRDTVPKPTNFYGDSKLQAEEKIRLLESDKFRLVVLRAPMVYGKGSKGNYPKLASYAQKMPFFPDIDNQRSMLHIDNLCEFIRLMIDNNERGLFFPQNAEYVKTAEMVRLIAQTHGKRIRLTKIFNLLLKLMGNFMSVINKAFGNLVYEQSMSDYKENYRVRNLKDSIKLSEEKCEG